MEPGSNRPLTVVPIAVSLFIMGRLPDGGRARDVSGWPMNQRRTINVQRVVKVLQGAARGGVSIPVLLDQCGIERLSLIHL